MKLSKQAVDLILNYKKKYPNASGRTIAKSFGYHHKTIQRVLKFEKSEDIHLTETRERSGDTEIISLPKTRIHTLEELIEYCEIDLNEWNVERWICNKWEVAAKDKEGDLQVEPLYQIKAWLKRNITVTAVKAEIESLKKLAIDFPWPVFNIRHLNNKTETPTGLMLEVNIPDLHAGKLAWGVETGGPNYDVRLAESLFFKALETILSRASGYRFDQIVFVIGNDVLNSDDIEGRTTAGTYVSTDARYHKTFVVVRDLHIKAIQRLRQVAPVKVIPVYGNHDRLSAWHLADSIEMFFTNDGRVEVDNRPRTRKYHQYGNVLLMFTHGDKGKKSDYPLVMATEEPVMFGSTNFRECHTGHIHMTKTDEQHGVRVRILPALCPADDWHSQNGFVGNKRSAEGYVWHKEQGLISIVFHNELD